MGEGEVWAGFLSEDRANYGYYMDYSSGRPKAWQPDKLPEELDARILRPFLEADDPTLQAGAAYLLALMGDRSGLPTLIGQWRSQPDDYATREMTVKAIAAVEDDEQVPILREIYNALDGYEKEYRGKTLYWTMRRMGGPKARELRKVIRDELGTALVR